MRLRIPILTTLAAIFFLMIVSAINAQEDPHPVPLSKDKLVPVSPSFVASTKSEFLPLQGGVTSLDFSSTSEESNQSAYEVSTNREDPLCDTPFGGYVDLEEINIFPDLNVQGDNFAARFFDDVGPINFFGMRYDEMWATDDGIVIFDAHKNFHRPWVPQLIADQALPNNVIAPLWQNMVVVLNRQKNHGLTAAKMPDNSILILEFDDVHLANSPKQTFDIEIVMQRKVSNKRGVYEIVFAYDNLRGSLEGPLTVGLENGLGDNATAFVNNEDASNVLEDGLIVCFNAISGAPPENAPEDVQASDGDHPDKVYVTWKDVEEAEGYEVFRARSADGEQKKLGHSDNTSFVDMTAEPGKAYAYWVTTCNSYGCSEFSDYDIGWRADLENASDHINFLPTIINTLKK